MQDLVNEAFAATPGDAGKVVSPDSFLTLHYHIALENGTNIVATFDGKPAALLLGRGQMTPMLEQALLGMREGEHTTFHPAPEHAFGPRNPKLLQRVSLATSCENPSLEEDYQLGDLAELSAPSDGKYAGAPKKMDEAPALFNFNHPLAGQIIVFEVQLIGILRYE